MDSTITPLEVIETCSALSRQHPAFGSFGVVNADASGASYQGTGMSIAATGVVLDGVTPRERKDGPSGTTTWSPPV